MFVSLMNLKMLRSSFRYGKYSPGAVTLIVINLHKSNSYQLDLQGTIGNNTKEEHLMTPSGTDGIQAR